jgi:hypothetical protein
MHFNDMCVLRNLQAEGLLDFEAQVEAAEKIFLDASESANKLPKTGADARHRYPFGRPSPKA